MVIGGLAALLTLSVGASEADGVEDVVRLVSIWLPVSFFGCLTLVLLSRRIWGWVEEGFVTTKKLSDATLSGGLIKNLQMVTSTILSPNIGHKNFERLKSEASNDEVIPFGKVTVYWRRLWARGIDLFAVYFIFNVFGIFIPEDLSSVYGIVGSVLFQAVLLSLLLLAYDTISVYKFGKTFGKAVLDYLFCQSITHP